VALFVVLATLALRYGANGHTYSVAPQTKIVVTLPSNQSTGFSWHLAARPNKQVVKLVSHRYVAPTASNPGSAGKEIWRLRAVGAGSTRLRLAYEQAGKTNSVARLFSVKIHVR
jgi:predicted secreted protein